MKKLIGGLTAFIIVMCIMRLFDRCENYSYTPQLNNDYNNSYNNGYTRGYDAAKSEHLDVGYKQGYETAKNEYQDSGYEKGYNKAREEYQAKINRLVADYETKIQESYKSGFTEGEVSMRDKITEQIELNARNKVRRGDWNAILFDPKD